MMEQEETILQPWERLETSLQEGGVREVEACLEDLNAADTALALSRLDAEERTRLLAILPSEEAADVLRDLPMEQAADLLQEIPPPDAATIIGHIPSDELVDILGDVRDEHAESIITELPAEVARQARQLMHYPADSAGGLMQTEYLAFRESMTVADVLADLQANSEQYADFDVQYAYIIGPRGRLQGVLRLRDLVLSGRNRPVRELMIRYPVSVRVDTSLEDLIALFDDHAFVGVPVLDEAGLLVGVVHRTEVFEAAETREKNIFLKISGIIGGEEFRSMPLFLRAFRRLSWLGPNIVLNMIAASIIALYQDTLQAAIALAVFLPIISDMSGCSGNQAVAVSIRELSLGMIKPGEFFRVFVKEAAVGLLNGILLGLLLGTVAVLWKGSLVLGLVVAGALAMNTLISVLLGGCIPLLLRRFKVDPALASGPILTTVTDMCGFFLVLSLASMVLDRL